MSPQSSIFLVLMVSCAGMLSTAAQQLNEKAARVLQPLLKRPGSEALFERFVSAWLDTGTMEDLEAWLERRVTGDPVASNRLLLALWLARKGQTVKALEQVRDALASAPGSAEIWYQNAVLESRTLDFEAAIASLTECLAQKPAGELPLQASQLLGRLQVRAGRADEALRTWEALMKSRPEDDDLREDILELQIAESLWPAAKETAEALVEATTDPYRRVLRRMRLGDVLDRSGQRDKALEIFTSCLADTGAGSWLEKEILGQIEKLFRREDDLSGLRTYFDGLLESHAHRAGLQRARARVLMESGDTEAAIVSCRAMLALSPGDRAAQEEFIALLTAAGRAAEAVSQVEQLLAHSPDDIELLLSLAGLKHAASDAPGAMAALQEYERKARGNAGTAIRVAGLMERYGATDEAVKILRADLDRADQPEARQMLASLLHKSGRKAEALAEWKRLAADGGLAQVQQVARALQSHGETAAAWEIMHGALAKAENDPVFLTYLCTLANEPERAFTAVSTALRLVELAGTASEVNHAIDVALRVVRLSGRTAQFTTELSQSASTAKALCLLAALKESERDSIGADEALEKARAMSPDLALAQQVRLWTVRGDFMQAAVAAESLFNSPGGRQAHVAEMLASLHQRAGSAEAALRWTREWRNLVPGAATPVLAEARLLESLGRETEALTALRTAAARFEGNEDIRARMASLSLGTGRTAEALRIYSMLYEEAADLSAKMRWLSQWGEAAEDAGQLDSLIAQFEDRRRENRGSVAPLMALAELHRIADNYDARRNALTGAARLKPDDPEIALEIARLEARENDEESAIRTLRPLLPKDPSGRVASMLADLLINSGQLDEGIRLLTERTAASPSAVELAALSLARRDEEATALNFLRPHLEKYPDDWRLHFLAALLEWRTNAPDAAAAHLLPLVNIDKPLARAGAAAASANAQSYDEMVVRLMPPDVQRLCRVLLETARLTATTYNQWGPSRQSPYTSLPASLEELHDRAAALMLEIARSAVEEKQSPWIAELERRGVASARLLLDLPPMRGVRPADRSFDFTALLTQYPDNRLMLAVAALSSGYRRWTEPADAVLASKAWAAFRADALPAAVYLALPGAGRGVPPAAWETEVLDAAKKLENPPAMLSMAAARSAGFNPGDDEAPEESLAPEPWRKEMTALLLRWRGAQAVAGAGTAASSVNNAVFQMLAKDCVRRRDATALAGLLDSEWRVQAAAPQTTSSRPDDLAAPLGFPPWFLPGIPDGVSYVLRSIVTSDIAAQTSVLVQEPVLKVMLAGRSNSDGVEQAIQAVQPAAATAAVPFILAAAWAEKRGDLAAAAEHAVKALYLPISHDVRRRLDGALAYWASRKGKPGDALHAAGRQAALRLRRDAATDESRAELATLMDKLGLTEEADRLMRQGKAAEAALASTPDERLERLLDEGKDKEALPALISDLRSWARQRINTSGEPSRDTFTKWRTRVQGNGLLPQVLQTLLPPRATAQQTAEYAAACDLLGNFDEARIHYEGAIAGGVKKNLPQLLMSLLVRLDHEAALNLLRKHPVLLSGEHLQRWLRDMVTDSDRTSKIEELLAVARFFERALQELPATHFGADFPARSVLEIVGGEAWAGELFTLSEVAEGNKPESRSSEPPAAETTRVEAVARERLAAYGRLAEAYSGIPALKGAVWHELDNVWTLQNKPPEPLLSLQFQMALREMEPDKPGQHTIVSPSDLGGTLNRLMQRAAKLGRTADFSREILPVVQRKYVPEIAEQLLMHWPLFEVLPEQFAASARDFVKKHGPNEWSAVIEAASERSIGAELKLDLLTFFSRPDPGSRVRNEESFGIWCAALERMEGRAAAEQFHRAVMEELLGPAAERASFFRDAKSPRLLTAMRLTANLAQQESWTGHVMRWIRAEFIPYATEESEEAMVDHFSEQTVSTPLFRLIGEDKLEEAKAYLDSLPLTDDLAGFYGVSGDVMAYASRALQNLPDGKRSALGLGGDRKTLTFGRLVLCGLAEGWMNGVCHELAGWEDRIAALPEPQGSLVQEQLRGLNGELAEDATPGARAFHAWLFRDLRARAREEMERDLEKFLQNAEQGKFENSEALMRSLDDLVEVMADEAHPRGRELTAAARRALAALDEPQEGSPLLEMLREQTGDRRGSAGGHAIPWLTGLIAGVILDGEPAAEAYDHNMAGLGMALLHSDDTSPEGRLSACVDRLGPYLRPGEARLLTMWLMEGLARHFSWQDMETRYAEGLQWAVSQRGQCAFEELRLELEMALRFQVASHASGEGRRAVTNSQLAPEQRHYLALLQDSALSESLRLTLGIALLDSTSLLDYRNGALEPRLVHETARLLHRALTDRQRVTPAQEARVFTGLALLPAETRDSALIKSLLTLTTLPRLRGGEPNEYLIATGLVALLDLALSSGDDGTAGRLLEMEGRFPGTGALAMLARHGQKQRLADLLKARPEVLQNTDDSFTFDQWDTALESWLPEALEMIADPVLRYEALVRLTLSSDPDPLPAGLKPRTERLQELAQAFAAVPWKGLAVRDRVLGAFFDWHDAAPEVLLPMIAESAARVPLTAVPFMDSAGVDSRAGFAAVDISRRVIAGDCEPLREALFHLQNLPRADFNVLSGIARRLLGFQHQTVLRCWPGMTSEIQAGLCSHWLRVADQCRDAGFLSEWLQELHFALLLHALAGRMQELEAWQSAMPETRRLVMRRYTAGLTPDDFVQEFGSALGRMPGTPDEQRARRLAVFTALAINPLGCGNSVKPDEDFLSLEGATPEEFLALEAPLTAAHPENGWVAAAFARVHAGRGAWEQALFRCHAALAKLKAERGTAYAPLLELRVRALEQMQRDDEALPELHALPGLPPVKSHGAARELSRAAEVRLLRRITHLRPSAK